MKGEHYMKALLIGNRERFIRFDPHTPFSDAVTKAFLDMEDLRTPLPAEVLDADFIAADAIAPVAGFIRSSAAAFAQRSGG